ncbi:MAG TPA: hypothetical protein VHT30_01320 [Acidimicrobiales bacterium]|jgi:hypothetical protein|nr:hypothetical protein [Acidimicrobiales bacterium]
MPRPKSENPKDSQLLVRITAADLRVLDAAAAVRRVTTAGYARGVLSRDIAVLKSDPLILRQLQIFEEFEARNSGSVTPIEESPRRRRKAAAAEPEE